ncbi:hypothetical protein KY284_027209 [Solanum tuberosum]|uniref:Uncharacterized protein n=1 Tax=Solanum tuberosum TaxID=4113 RepID=M1D6Z3_SOLTU|nr:hypothetical protein KY284_027209 [Solanum tuberosum]
MKKTNSNYSKRSRRSVKQEKKKLKPTRNKQSLTDITNNNNLKEILSHLECFAIFRIIFDDTISRTCNELVTKEENESVTFSGAATGMTRAELLPPQTTTRMSSRE